MDKKEKFRQMMLKLLNHPRLSLFSYTIYNYKMELLDIDEKSCDNKSVLDKLTAFATIKNGKPYIGFFSKFVNECSVEELLFVAIHEMLHIIEGHSLRTGERNAFIANLASDHVINDPLISDSGNTLSCIRIPTGRKAPFVIDKLKGSNKTFEEVYSYLMERSITVPTTVSFNVKNEGSSSEVKIQVQTTTVNLGKQKISVVTDVIPSNSEDADDVIEHIKASTRAALNEAKNRGLNSGNLTDLIDRLIKVKIPWDKLYEKTIRSKSIISPDRRVWTNPRKRLRAHGFILPGPTYDKKASTLVVSIDTSGSISDEDLARFIYITIQGARLFDQVRIINHDTIVKKDVTIDSLLVTEENFKYNKDLMEVHGRGGTSHKSVFKLLEKSKDESQDMSLIVFLTDNFSDFHCIEDFSWQKEYPFVMLLTKNHHKPSKDIDFLVIDDWKK